MNQTESHSSLFSRIEQYARTHVRELGGQLNERPHFLLGISGGPDSVFLFHFLRSLHNQELIRLTVANLDHGWPSFSATEMLFCKRLCETYNILFITKKISELELQVKYNGSQEEAGRRYRRYFLEQVKTSQKADYIVLAHQADEQQETFFIRLLRGTSLSGLTCMKPNDGTYLRPLLTTTKAEILQYLAENEIPFFVDPTNQMDTKLRNRIRNNLIPELQSCDKRFDQTFAHTLANLQSENDYLHKLMLNAFDTIFTKTESALKGNLTQFRSFDQVIQKRLIIHWLVAEKVPFLPSNAHLEEIIRFLMNPAGGSHGVGKKWGIIKKESLFLINREIMNS